MKMNREINDLLNNMLEQITKELTTKKTELIIQRISEFAKLEDDFDIEMELSKMFPRLRCIYQSIDMSEHWYWDNGTYEGKKIISFFQNPNFGIHSEKVSVGFQYK